MFTDPRLRQLGSSSTANLNRKSGNFEERSALDGMGFYIWCWVSSLRNYRGSLSNPVPWLADSEQFCDDIPSAPFPPRPLSLPLSFPLPATHQAGVPAARRATQHTDSCDWPATKEGKMEHRHTDFNIMLATDSYKVRRAWWLREQGGSVEGSGRWNENG